MRFRITCKGGEYGTTVYNADTGEKIEHVSMIAFRHEAGEVPRVFLQIVAPDLEIETQEFVPKPPDTIQD